MSTEQFDFFAIRKELTILSPDAVGESRPTAALLLMLLFGILTAVLLVWFFRRFKRGSRSYTDAGIMAAAVFTLMSFTEWAQIFYHGYSRDMFIYFDSILLYQTCLPFELFGAMLVVSNAVLLFKEGFRLKNLLAACTGMLIGVGIHVAFALNCLEAKWIGDLLIDCFASLFYLFFCSVFFGMCVTCFIYAHQRPSLDRDYAIVLGCRVIGGKVTPLLRNRIDTALRFYKKQLKRTGKAPTFILSGGQGPDEAVSEAEAMRNYLLEQGVPESHMILEDRSESTLENFVNSRNLITKTFPEGKGVFSTTNFHVFRSELLCRKVGLDAVGLAAPVKWYYMPNAFVREIVATVSADKKAFLLSLAGMTAVTVTVCLWQWAVIHPGMPMF